MGWQGRALGKPLTGGAPVLVRVPARDAIDQIRGDLKVWFKNPELTWSVQEDVLVVDFLDVLADDARAHFQIVSDWAKENQDWYFRFTSVAIRFRGETVTGYVRCSECFAVHRVGAPRCPPRLPMIPTY
ncbi:hypothetical protein [Luteibacter yeojuensis]|uniref:Uncharacterized protein n=1 Tax=Luteibacter yeojuensis TaxID=345309 RepID=A0A0F3KS58_9GAMM|nr:hypothetical protein [Luteibacter yeojuensis]KJV33802.1 hypothetical protein VI08_10590 [Luteibacter yeojuensis]